MEQDAQDLVDLTVVREDGGDRGTHLQAQMVREGTEDRCQHATAGVELLGRLATQL